eukprot:COSAG01_NODE_4314_length_5139_cov_22.559413_2_plen_101_part_00
MGDGQEAAGVREALWLSHIQGALIIGKRRDEIFDAFRKAGRPTSLGFITYRPPELQEYQKADDLLTSGHVEVENLRASREKAYDPFAVFTGFGDKPAMPQ